MADRNRKLISIPREQKFWLPKLSAGPASVADTTGVFRYLELKIDEGLIRCRHGDDPGNQYDARPDEPVKRDSNCHSLLNYQLKTTQSAQANKPRFFHFGRVIFIRTVNIQLDIISGIAYTNDGIVATSGVVGGQKTERGPVVSGISARLAR